MADHNTNKLRRRTGVANNDWGRYSKNLKSLARGKSSKRKQKQDGIQEKYY